MGLTKIIASILLLMGFVVAAQAQVTVTLVDGEGKPVAEATVEANKKVIGKTDADGTATLDASYLNQQLCFTHVSFQLFCEKVTNNVNKFTLKSNDNFLDAAVVTSYENTTRRNTVGNVSSIDMSKVPVLNNSNTLAALQGLAPGLDIQVSGGGLGQASRVRVQGDQSLLFAAPPIYVVDGVVVSEYQTNALATSSISLGGIIPNISNQNARGNFIDFLDFNNIESITILKDADAVGIYGSRAANGAIVIKTKKATNEKISLSVNVNFSWLDRRMELMNTEEYLYMRRTAIKNSNVTNLNGPNYFDLTLYDSTEYNDWQKILMSHTIMNYNIGLNISTFSNKSSNSFSFSFKPNKHFYDEKGKFNQFFLNNTWNSSLFGDKLNITNTSSISYLNSSQRSSDLTSFALTAPPNYPIELFNKNEIRWKYKEQDVYLSPNQHPLYHFMSVYKYDDFKILNSTNFKYTISRNMNLNLNYGVSMNILSDERVEKINREGTIVFPNFSNNYILKKSESWVHNLDAFLTKKIDRLFNKIDIINIIGFNLNQSNTDVDYFHFSGKVNETYSFNYQYYPNVSSKLYGTNMYKYAAIYNRFVSNYKNFSFNVNYRYDGSSRFAPENRWSSFYSFALGWNISDSKWWALENTFLKIRSSYGKLGNDNIPDYAYLQKFRLQASENYPNNSIVDVINLYSRNYKWEDLRKINLGFDFIWNNISMIFDYTKSTSKDQLINYRIPDYLGQSNIFMNFPGVFQTESFEFTFGYRFNIGNNKVNTNLMFTIPKDKLISFPNLELSSYANDFEVGRTKNLARLPVYGGVDPNNGLYYYLDQDGNKTSSISNAKTEFVETPVVYYSNLGIDFEVKKIKIYANVYMRKSLSSRGVTLNYSIGSAPPGGLSNNYRFLLDNFDSNNSSEYQKFLAFGGSIYPYDSKYLRNIFLRINNLNFLYRFDSNRAKNKYSLEAGVYINNILLYTNVNAFNYENVSNTIMPQLVNLGAMIKLNF